MRVIRALPALLLLAAALSCQADVPAGLPGCGNGCPSGGGGSGLGAHEVHVRNNYYSPSTLNVGVGDSVTFTWDTGPHSVTFPSGGAYPNIDLGVQSTGSITIIVPQSGTYSYYCTIHGANAMSGTLIVQ